ncbi:MAG: ribonuclease III [Lachnospiraceae bacterium]|nr:ribonuclease III [Lachnospiraceae bacterium]MDY6222412.1 ribonuclease III [Candidatus Alectryocaccobium sp.]
MKKSDLEELQNTIGYSFKDSSILKNAVIHSSFVNEHKLKRNDCNERLEFLGDAVLELVSSEFLYKEYKDMPEGELTKLRASLVCEPALAFDARGFGLQEHLLMGKGEEQTGGRERDSIVSDACEALIGAIFLDGGFEAAKAFILKFVLNDAENKKLFYDSKSVLQEMTQKIYEKAPEYCIVDENGPAHAKVFKARVSINGDILGEGTGRTKKHAEQQASYQAIIKLKNGR